MVLNQHVQVAGFKNLQLFPMTSGKSVNVSSGYLRSLKISLYPIFYYPSPFLTLQLNHPSHQCFGYVMLLPASVPLLTWPPLLNSLSLLLPTYPNLSSASRSKSVLLSRSHPHNKFPFLSPSLCYSSMPVDVCVLRTPGNFWDPFRGPRGSQPFL